MFTVIMLIGLALLAVGLNFDTTFVPGPPDEATRQENSRTITATDNGTSLDLGAGFLAGGSGQEFCSVINTSALDLTSGNETYAAKVQESADNSTWVDISPSVSITAAGVKSIPVYVSQRYVRTVLTLGGTTPSITYQAHLIPHLES